MAPYLGPHGPVRSDGVTGGRIDRQRSSKPHSVNPILSLKFRAGGSSEIVVHQGIAYCTDLPFRLRYSTTVTIIE